MPGSGKLWWALPFSQYRRTDRRWFRAPTSDPAQFGGLRIRSVGLPALVLAGMGAAPGNVGAADWIGPHDDRAIGFHQVAPFYHYPGALEPSAQLSLIIAPSAWKALPKTWREAVRTVAAAAEPALLVRYDALNPVALAALEDEGTKLVRFPDAVLDAMRTATDAILQDLAAADSRFAAALDSYRRFDALGQDWAAMREATTAKTIHGRGRFATIPGRPSNAAPA